MISLLSFYGVYIGKTLFPPLEVVGRYPSVKAVQQVILEHMMEKRDMNPVFVMNDLLGNTTNFDLYVISSILYFLICHLLLVSFLLPFSLYFLVAHFNQHKNGHLFWYFPTNSI